MVATMAIITVRADVNKSDQQKVIHAMVLVNQSLKACIRKRSVLKED